ncbi:hypothetical protein PAHAL_3G213200 [Panicum hallii]|uniref:DUF834 domain-containing protein n=1 Tax=Panicum hallii TaxID=206008 RepID=A0A2T8KIY7_9POAL|nr:hypothetical protein PAHAL_3G213200 [Panicum hallii]
MLGPAAPRCSGGGDSERWRRAPSGSGGGLGGGGGGTTIAAAAWIWRCGGAAGVDPAGERTVTARSSGAGGSKRARGVGGGGVEGRRGQRREGRRWREQRSEGRRQRERQGLVGGVGVERWSLSPF